MKHIPESDIADLRLPFYATSTNLTTGEAVVHQTGGVHRVIRVNWPPFGMLPPFVNEEGEILASGSLSDPLPVAQMQAMKDGVNFLCAPKLEPAGRSPMPYNRMSGGLKTRLASLFGGAKAPPALALEHLLVRGFTVSQTCGARRMLAGGRGNEMLFMPVVARTMSAIDWKLHSKIKDMAYQWGLAEIDRLESEGHPLIVAALNER